MPLIYDAEYQEELEKLMRKATSGNRQVSRAHLLATAVAFAGLFGYLIYSGVSDTKIVAAGIGLSTLCLVAVINSAVRTMHVSLALLIATVEWVGRKQLGEYESPGA